MDLNDMSADELREATNCFFWMDVRHEAILSGMTAEQAEAEIERVKATGFDPVLHWLKNWARLFLDSEKGARMAECSVLDNKPLATSTTDVRMEYTATYDGKPERIDVEVYIDGKKHGTAIVLVTYPPELDGRPLLTKVLSYSIVKAV